jgi:hypothetical protein
VKLLNRYAATAVLLVVAGPLYAADPVPLPAPPSSSPAAEDTTTVEINALRARLDQLETRQRQAAQQAEINKTAEQVSEDAMHRSQMLDVGAFSAGYKNGRFYIGSEDGNFMFRPWLHMQFRDVTVDRANFKDGGKDDQIDNGFEMRRARFGFDGNVFSPDLTYFFNWATVRSSSNSTVKTTSAADSVTIGNNLGGVPLLEEAWVKYHFANTPWSIKAGQIKDPFMHDQIVSSKYQQSAERSLIADIFANGDAFTQGVSGIYDPHSWFRAEAAFTQGIRSANTNFQPPQDSSNGFNYGAAGRAEFKLMGRWQDYDQVGAVGTTEPLLVIGVGSDYSERGGLAGQTMGVVDVMYADQNGFNLYGAAVDRYTDHNFGIYTQSATGASIGTPNPAVAGRSTNEYAGLMQVGYLINNHWEPFGRYEYMRLQGTPAGSQNYVQAITGGVNYYFYGHRAKITAQLEYLPKGIPINDTPSDTLVSPGGNHEFSGIVQFQLLL